jgi:hypothetical protein
VPNGRGRPPKPIEQKKKSGTYRPDRDPSNGNLAVVPAVEPDGWELPVAEALERVLEMGVPWLGSTDNPTLSLLGDALELADRAKAAGSIREQIAAQEHVAKLLAQLGFDPTSRARLGLAEVSRVSKLEALKAKG